MGWLRKMLKGSASNSRIPSDPDEDSRWDEPRDSSDEVLDSEREETHYATTVSSVDEIETEEDQQSDASQSETETCDEQYHEATHLEEEDDRLTEALQQSLIFNSNHLCDIENIFPPFPFSFHSIDRSRDKERHRPICYVCKNQIPVNASGRFQYKSNRFWRQKYCSSHAHDGTHRCCSCRRLEPRDTTFSSLTDGRKLCLDCHGSSIMNTDQCQPLYHEVCEFYESLNMKVYQTIPLYLVERQVLNEVGKSENKGHHLFEERSGVTMTKGCSINAIVEQSRIRDGDKTKIKTKRYKLVAYSEVIAIIILYGFPRLLTGRILAHEMMHAWLRLEGYPFISLEVEEGLCEVMAHMWLESQISSMSTSQNHFEKRLAEYLKHDIKLRTSHPYGTGFQRAKRVIDMYGLKGTIDYIRMMDTFPG